MIDLPALFPDVAPISQNDGPEPPVCSISYSPEFIQAHDYLRALLRFDERSKRALQLTTVCLEFNPANYTVWHYRRRILMSLISNDSSSIDDKLIEQDLDFADTLGGGNPKNYQLWYHRRALLQFRFTMSESEGAASENQKLRAGKKELEYVDKILNDDSKNYHAWSHRQWIVRRINHPQLWQDEIDYSHSKILSDPRNNSAWNQRWFATHEGQISSMNDSISIENNCKTSNKEVYERGKGGMLSLKRANEEAHYGLCGAKIDPYNESPWRYLVGVLMEQWRYVQRKENDAQDITNSICLIHDNIAQIKELKKSFDDERSSDDYASIPCISLLSALVDLLEIFTEDRLMLVDAKALCNDLSRIDPVRRKFWLKREMDINDTMKKLK